MHPNAALIDRFYTAFTARDGDGMAECYAPDATFQDPVFTLQGADCGHMWRMLCKRGKDLQVTYSDVNADDASGTAHWEATYTFSATGRSVHNVIDAAFTFEGGLIKSHRDTFDMWRWTRMALGPKGVLLGWLPPVQGAIRKQAAAGLVAYKAKEGLQA